MTRAGRDAAAGRARALRSLYDASAGTVLALARRLLGDRAEAEDVVEATFLELGRGDAELGPGDAAVAEALATGRARALARLRARGHAPPPGGADLPPPPPPAATPPGRVRARAALDALPPDARDVVVLACFEGLTHGEIAARTRRPVAEVRARLREGLERVAAALEVAP